MNRPPTLVPWALLCGIALATALCVFVLPFFVPPTRLAYGQSYVVGFNNMLAVLALAVISVTVTFVRCRDAGSAVQQDDSSQVRTVLSPRYLAAACGVMFLWIGTLSWLAFSSNAYSLEGRYFMPQMSKVLLFHRKLYYQVEFAYGPLLFQPTVLLSRVLHYGPDPIALAYYVTLLLHHALGLSMLFYVVNRLPLSLRMKAGLFSAIAVYSLNLWLGLNYTLARFVLPFFLLCVLDSLDRPFVTAALCVPAVLLSGAVSPELSIALSCGLAVYAVCRGLRQDRRWFACTAGVAAGSVLAVTLAPKGLLELLRGMSSGYDHWVIVPSPVLLVSLVAIVWLAPNAVSCQLRRPDRYLSLTVGFYALSLSLLPPMFGFAEMLHYLSNGIGFLLLAGVALSRSARGGILWSRTVTACYVLLLYVMLHVGWPYLKPGFAHLYAHPAFYRLTSFLPRRGAAWVDRKLTMPPVPSVQVSDWRTYLGTEHFYVPYEVDHAQWQSVLLSPQNDRGYFNGTIDVWGPKAEDVKLRELREQNWAFAQSEPNPEIVSNLATQSTGIKLNFQAKHQVGASERLATELKTHWKRVAGVAPGYSLYQKVRTDGPTP